MAPPTADSRTSQCIPNPKPYTLNLTPYTLHPTPRPLVPKADARRATRHDELFSSVRPHVIYSILVQTQPGRRGHARARCARMTRTHDAHARRARTTRAHDALTARRAVPSARGCGASALFFFGQRSAGYTPVGLGCGIIGLRT